MRQQLVIVLFGSIALLTGLGATRLWDQDEGYFAGTAAEMYARGDWVTPRFNGELFAHKPPLMYWMMIAGFELFGRNEFSARFFSAVFGVATALLVYRLGRRLFSAEAGLWAALAVVTCLMFDVVARAATPDCFLVFFSTLAVYFFVTRCGEARLAEADTGDAGSAEASDAPREAAIGLPHTPGEELPQPPAWRRGLADWTLVYAATGLAVLAKGPIGVLLPTTVIGLYLLLSTPHRESPPPASWRSRAWDWLKRFSPFSVVRCAWRMRPLLALAVVLLVAGPWFLLVYLRTDGQFLREFIWKHHVHRFLEPMDNHEGPFWYYLPAIAGGFFPWSVFFVPAAIELVRSIRGGGRRARACLLLVCWAAVYVLFFSKAGTKLPNYVLPAYPAIALAVGAYFERWLARNREVGSVWSRIAFAALAIAGLTLIALPLVARLRPAGGMSVLERIGASPALESDVALLVWLGLIPVAGAAAAFVFDLLSRRRPAAWAMAVTAVAFVTGSLAGVAQRIDRHQLSEDLASTIEAHSTGTPRVAQFGYFRPSLVYYLGGKLEACNSASEVSRFLAAHDDAFVVLPDNLLERVAAQLPDEAYILERRPTFPKQGHVLVLARRPLHVARDGRGPAGR